MLNGLVRRYSRWLELRRLHRYYDMVLVFWVRGKMTDREMHLHAEWVLEQKDKLNDERREGAGV